MSLETTKKALEIVATILVSVAATIVIIGRFSASARDQNPSPRLPDITGRVIDAKSIRHALGTGRVALVEFSDYECPACGSYAKNTAPRVKTDLVDKGQLRLVTFNFPLRRIHPNAQMAAEAAECAARQGRHREMYEALFAAPRPVNTDVVARLRQDVGLEQAAFTQCQSGQATDAVAADVAEARKLGVTSTPTFFVGLVTDDGSIQLSKRIVGAAPFELIQKLVSEVHGRAPAAVTRR